MEDNSIINIGPYRGKKLANVPADYLLEVYKLKSGDKELLEYIEDNLEVLKKEVNSFLVDENKSKKKKVVKKNDEYLEDEEEFLSYDEEEDFFDESEESEDF